MSHKHSFRKTIFGSFILVFALFTIAVFIFQYKREKEYKVGKLENTLENVVDIAHNYIEFYDLYAPNSFFSADTLEALIPQKNIRLTVIDKTGTVLYDSFMEESEQMENHFERPEIQKAISSETGSDIRRSETTNISYYYYARNFQNYFVRAAIVYDIAVEDFLKVERFFIFFIIAIFGVIWGIINYITKRLSISITNLEEFSIKAANDEPIDNKWKFPDNELGEIGTQIINIYDNLRQTKDDLALEKSRLFSHMNILNEGIAFFKPNKEMIMANSHFIQYISIISGTTTIQAEQIFEIPDFEKIKDFLEKRLKDDVELINSNDLSQIEFIIDKKGSYFKILCILFADKGFEIIITDITQPEKRRLLKQQLTTNIAHELKTPLASIKGYLETLMNMPEIDKKRRVHFISKAYAQAERLNLLLNDVSLLNNIEEANELFEIKDVNVKNIISEVIENLNSRLGAKNIKCKVDVGDNVVVKGNDSLLSSVFQNLIENSIEYAGENITIEIKHYLEDNKNYYFCYSDSGVGIPAEHLHRIFERFYRVDSGRTRKSGGTGLGLSIVKNAILFHKGKISARNREEGGIEFLFSLSKK